MDMPLHSRPRGPLWMAVAGKGGTGKSLVAGTLSRVLARRGHPVLAIDTDPMPGLTSSLGIAEPQVPLLMDAGWKPEGSPWRLRPGVGPATVVRRHTTAAPDGVRMLQLGKADKDGLASVNASVSAFLVFVRRLHEAPSLRRWAVVGDLAAGPRQPGAGFTPYARVYLVMVEASSQSALAARRVARLARGPLEAEVVFVASKIGGAADRSLVERLLGEPAQLEIPLDPAVREAEREHRAVVDVAPDGPFVSAVERLADIVEARRETG
jgi:CO dehydrogenase maturation factor